MTTHARGPEGSAKQHVRAVAVEGQRAELVLAGQVTGTAAREIEEILLDPALRDVSQWAFDLSEVEVLDAMCAFALVRPLLRASSPAALVHVRGAHKQARGILRQTGAGHLVTFED